MQNIKILILISSLLILLSGCAATGKSFSTQQLEAAPENMGVVYFFRPKSFVGSATKFKLTDDNKLIGKIQNGQFLKHVTTPGKHVFSTDYLGVKDIPVDIVIEAGKNYFVRVEQRTGAFISTFFLSRVYPEEAMTEIAECCKSGE